MRKFFVSYFFCATFEAYSCGFIRDELKSEFNIKIFEEFFGKGVAGQYELSMREELDFRGLEKGSSVVSYLQQKVPNSFKKQFSSEFNRVIRLLKDSKYVDKATFEHTDGTDGIFEPRTKHLIIDLGVTARLSPVGIFIAARHELRHAITESSYRSQRITLKTWKSMSASEFRVNNLRAFLRDESISVYGDIIFLARMAQFPQFKKYVWETLNKSILRTILPELIDKNPRIGLAMLEEINGLVAEEIRYKSDAKRTLTDIYELFTKSNADIGRVNGKYLVWSVFYGE